MRSNSFLRRSLHQEAKQYHEHPNDSFYSILAARAASAAGMIFCFTEYVADLTLCEGPSMLPTIQSSGEIVMIDKWSIRRGLEGGTYGAERAKQALKRQAEYKDEDFWHQPRVSISNLPPLTWKQTLDHTLSPLSVGDVVVVNHPARNSTVCKRIVGLPGDQVLNRGLLIVPDGHLWLEGDNPANSTDSRHYGTVPASLVVGRVLARIWPLRGHAWMQRGERPITSTTQPANTTGRLGSAVLPAGYQGQHIIKK
jgi:signal peptidase I